MGIVVNDLDFEVGVPEGACSREAHAPEQQVFSASASRLRLKGAEHFPRTVPERDGLVLRLAEALN